MWILLCRFFLNSFIFLKWFDIWNASLGLGSLLAQFWQHCCVGQSCPGWVTMQDMMTDSAMGKVYNREAGESNPKVPAAQELLVPLVRLCRLCWSGDTDYFLQKPPLASGGTAAVQKVGPNNLSAAWRRRLTSPSHLSHWWSGLSWKLAGVIRTGLAEAKPTWWVSLPSRRDNSTGCYNPAATDPFWCQSLCLSPATAGNWAPDGRGDHHPHMGTQTGPEHACTIIF